MTKTVFHIERIDWGRCFALHFGIKGADGIIARCSKIEFTKHSPQIDPRTESPAIELSEDDAKRLMDELWSLGVRPTEGHGSTGQLAATEKHLNDSRTMLQQCLDTILIKAQHTP